MPDTLLVGLIVVNRTELLVSIRTLFAIQEIVYNTQTNRTQLDERCVLAVVM